MATNLPPTLIKDSASQSKVFFDNYGKQTTNFTATDIDATVAFFTSLGFDKSAAVVTAETLLKQAYIDNVPIFTLLDTLKRLNGIELSVIVAQILNNNRIPTSTLGYRTTSVQTNKIRSVLA